ncbi:Ferrienterobactin-binding periplasmic protein [Andreprevotia sp. IGB-42]|uniref:Fe2+-enterobactin ABC transporter substrate-binding protein n=1 Tax=Andreprevotia sp. IGB-42 TaxID=2497473 RepID=UPI00157E6CA0|nr:Fe2+-enterobactin ABC transporter substrate-binding protein [Andreprevotia sp. IGB-42]KAF0812632.1 Ferrienterobactin-binding periplasmic protein [Andreprevotia sp. IGB-42]
MNILKVARSGFIALLCASVLSACGDKPGPAAPVGSAPAAAASTGSAGQQGWPRTVDSSKGKVTLAAQPQRIVSTSVTLTGALLAINAPVVGSGASSPNSTVTDDQGFFRQWSSIAKARKVQPLYNGEPDAEAIVNAAPDLILIAGTGGDSAIRLYEQLSQIAPTVVINYDNKSWEELALQLGVMTGHEQDANAVVARFAGQLQQTRARLKLPPQPTSALVYYEDDTGANVWTAESAQGKLLTELGFTLATVPASVRGNTSMGVRKDIVQLGGEKMADGLQGQTMLLFSADDSTTRQVKANKFLARNPAVAADRVYAVGLDTFRLDYYSASNLLKRLEERFR